MCRLANARVICFAWLIFITGWCLALAILANWRWAGATYGVGDHMSHYNVNVSVPKTLIQHLISVGDHERGNSMSRLAKRCCSRLLETEISPLNLCRMRGRAEQQAQKNGGQDLGRMICRISICITSRVLDCARARSRS